MEYNQLKLEIESSLESNGYVKNENKDSLYQVKEQQQIVVINGVQQNVVNKIEIVLECLGEGYIDNTPTIGYKLLINYNDLGDFWMSNVNDLKVFKLI